MKVLVTGGRGQLGRELADTCPADVQLLAPSSEELDIADTEKVEEYFNSLRPDAVINSAAYTAVDQAEQEPGAAYRVNATGAENIAIAAARAGIRLVHISTDFVFDGSSSRPYRPEDETAPLSVYGASKLQGEKSVLERHSQGSVIIRTSWLYSSHGRNFVKTMLGLMQSRSLLKVVADQAGTPTWARGLANTVWKAVLSEVTGILHWSDSGIASWYDFACAVARLGKDAGLVSDMPQIFPVNTEEYPVPAKRPSYSVLDKSETVRVLGIQPPHWQDNLEKMINTLERDSLT